MSKMRERKPEEKGTSSYMNTICNTFKTFSVLNTLYFRNYLLLSGKKKKNAHITPGIAALVMLMVTMRIMITTATAW